MSLIEARGLSKNYGPTRVLNDLNFQLQRGSVVGLLGRNASGKSTLFRLIAGVTRPSQGKLLIDGQPAGPVTRRWVMYAPEVPCYYPAMQVYEQLLFLARFYPSWDHDKAQALLGEMELDPKAVIGELSKGLRARLKLVHAFAWDNDVVLLDEPFEGIDQPSRQKIVQLLFNEYRHQRQTIILGTHHIDETEQLFDQVLILKAGRLVCQRPIDELRDTYQQPLVQTLNDLTL